MRTHTHSVIILFKVLKPYSSLYHQ